MHKILIVDDETQLCRMAAKYLEAKGFAASTANGGEEALAKCADLAPQVVLLDIQMPGMGGVECLNRIKSGYPDTEVIMVTAMGDVNTAVSCIQAGAFGYQMKPVDLEGIVVEINKALEHRRLVLENRDYQANLEAKVEEKTGTIKLLNEKLLQVTALTDQIAHVNDLDVLLETILSLAMKFVSADAGSIYLREEADLKFSYARNNTLSKDLPPGKKLIYTTFSLPVDNTSIAGYVANNGLTLNIPDAYRLPEDAPYHFGKKFDEISKYRTSSILAVPLKTSMGVIVGVLQLINAKDGNGRIKPFSKEDEPFVNYFASNAAIALERAQMTRAIILRMINMAELRDPKETGAHVNRVAAYAVEIYEHWARQQGIPENEINKNKDILRSAAMLHDVGKVAISDIILKKPGKFTPEEYEIMKQHAVLGAKLFESAASDFETAAQEIACNHHERWDGKGYPGHVDVMSGQGLAGHEDENGNPRGKREEEIPLFGRIVAIADVFDALMSRRVYKDAWDQSKTLDMIREGRGTQFDPLMVDSFFHILEIINSIRARFPDI